MKSKFFEEVCPPSRGAFLPSRYNYLPNNVDKSQTTLCTNCNYRTSRLLDEFEITIAETIGLTCKQYRSKLKKKYNPACELRNCRIDNESLIGR